MLFKSTRSFIQASSSQSLRNTYFAGMLKSSELESVYSKAQEIYSAAIKAVSPVTLVSQALQFDKTSNILTVENKVYQLNRNVKVVAFGKAVLGMVAAVECILGDHIMEGVASIPVDAMETARENFPHYLPASNSKIKICEGAQNNLPDRAAESTAREILKLVKEAKEEELILVLTSGGGSALLPYPVNGVTLEEKRQVVDCLARHGASIQELNAFRKALSQTKGGKLARAAYPSKLLSLILSDVIGDPLDIIASGPTVPNLTSHSDVLAILDKYTLRDKAPQSVISYLTAESVKEIEQPCVPVSNRQYIHTQNVLIGTNSIAIESALLASKKLGFRGCVWSHSVQGEARVLGEALATFAYNYLLEMNHRDSTQLERPRTPAPLIHCLPEMKESFLNLDSTFQELLQDKPQLVCLISGGEPTVTVTGEGRGGRNQEMALAFAIKLHELKESAIEQGKGTLIPGCVFVSVGTDGQDGPCDAAGAIVDGEVVRQALEQDLDPKTFLTNNDSYNFFSMLDQGKHLIKTGLTGTNVMDVQLLLLYQR